MRVGLVFFAVFLPAGSSIGCSLGHQFSLSDLNRLSLGTSTRTEVEARLGEPRDFGVRLPHRVYRSWQTQTEPPYLLALLTWPLYWSTREEEYVVAARYDQGEVLQEMSLEISGSSHTFILLLIQPHFLAPRLDRGRLDQLRELEAKGVKVSIEAYYGKLSIEEYVDSFGSLADDPGEDPSPPRDQK
ncbi:MAG TPA: hypothetical protein VMU54_14635 [Planctomycetota bacterium]|nr:hypothetical protein [Planctomycetota bacterium]